jgi:hypothetical protein
VGRGIDADWRDLPDPFNVQLAYVFGAHDRMGERCHAALELRIPLVVEKPLGMSVGPD